jgi:hypothetical protein
LRKDIIGTNGRLGGDRIVLIMSLLRQNIPVLLNGLDIIIILLTDYESTVFKIMVWHGYCL